MLTAYVGVVMSLFRCFQTVKVEFIQTLILVSCIKE